MGHGMREGMIGAPNGNPIGAPSGIPNGGVTVEGNGLTIRVGANSNGGVGLGTDGIRTFGTSSAVNSVKLVPRHAFGCHATRLDSLMAFSSGAGGSSQNFSDRLLHKVGRRLAIYDPETDRREFLDHAPSLLRASTSKRGVLAPSTAATSRSAMPSSSPWASKNVVVDVLHFQVYNNQYLAVAELVRQVQPHTAYTGTLNSTTNNLHNTAQLTSVVGSHGTTNLADYTAIPSATNHNSGAQIVSQVAVYSLATNCRLKTLQHNAVTRPYACVTFCDDHKYVAALTEEPDRLIVLWQWEKEKVYKTVSVSPSISVNILRAPPCGGLMLSTTGSASIKCWGLAVDGTIKPTNILPAAKESLDNYLDHLWLAPHTSPAAMGGASIYRMVVLAEPDPTNDLNRNRRQCIYVFEGQEERGSAAQRLMANHTGANHRQGTAAPTLPFQLELRQTITLRVDSSCQIEKLIPSNKAFVAVGTQGRVLIYERTEEKHEPFLESRRMAVGDIHLVGGAVYPSEEKLVLLAKSGRLLSLPLDMSIEQIKLGLSKSLTSGKDDDDKNNSTNLNAYGIADVTVGGHHTSTIISADVAYERPLLATLSSDHSLRIWNYLTGKCELVHHFPESDGVLAVAFHASGFQLLVSTSDRVRLFHVFMDQLKSCRETICKDCKVLSFSHGSQFWAAATGINLYIYDTRTFAQLRTFQGHMMAISRIIWAPGDQIIFSASVDGNIFAWPLVLNGSAPIVTANNRSTAIISMAIDCPSSIFPVSVRESEDDNHSAPASPSKMTHVSNDGETMSVYSTESERKVMTMSEITSAARSWLILSSTDGNIRLPSWGIDLSKRLPPPSTSPPVQDDINPGSSTAVSSRTWKETYPQLDGVPIIYNDSSILVTAMQLTSDRSKLVVGTSVGSVRVYPWPPDPAHLFALQQNIPPAHSSNPFISTPVTQGLDDASLAAVWTAIQNGTLHHPILCNETFCHRGPVVSVHLGTIDNTVITAGADGSVFVHTLQTSLNGPGNGFNSGARSGLELLDGDENRSLNTEVVLLATTDIEAHNQEVMRLQQQFTETQEKYESHGRRLQAEHEEKLRALQETHESLVLRETEAFEKQQENFRLRIQDLQKTLLQKDHDHVCIIKEIESKYERRLRDQLNRYDQLSERMASLKQKCEGLLEHEKTEFISQKETILSDAHKKEKRLTVDIRRAVHDRRANEQAFTEILTQQENEYEDEMRRLIVSTEGVLLSKRETIQKLRQLKSTKNSKLESLKKSYQELQTVSNARAELLKREVERTKRLKDTISHYQKNLTEREDALTEKERVLQELGHTKRTLENFRFVLDHRLQQLSSERGPISAHIQGLEKHISTMYEELVEEFSAKKSSGEAASLREQKLSWLQQDLTKLRASVKEKENVISAFKREVTTLVGAAASGKELEDSLKILYKKFVRGESSAGKSIVQLNSQVVGTVTELLHGRKIAVAQAARRSNVTDSGLNDIDTGEALSLDEYLDDTIDEQSFYSVDTDGNNGLPPSAAKQVSKVIDETLIATAKEAHRQKKFVEKKAAYLRHNLIRTEKESIGGAQSRLHENSDLLYECNELRSVNRDLLHRIDTLQHELNKIQRQVHEQRMIRLEEARVLAKTSKSPPRTTASQAVADGRAIANGTGNTGTIVAEGVAAAPSWVVHNVLPVHQQLGTTAPLDLASPLRVSSSATPLVLEAKTLTKGLNSKRNGASRISQSLPTLPQVLSSTAPLPKSSVSREPKMSRPESAVALTSITSMPKSKQNTTTLPATPEALSSEVERASTMLDDLRRQKALQQRELNALRRMKQQLSTSLGLTNTQQRVGGTLEEQSSYSFSWPPEMGMEHPQALTNADVFGQPSQSDLMEMRVGPVSNQGSRVATAKSATQRTSSSSRNMTTSAPNTASRKILPNVVVGGNDQHSRGLVELSLNSQSHTSEFT